jgi:alkylation response protein AidB-like acyl-CoA dehydrogenase
MMTSSPLALADDLVAFRARLREWLPSAMPQDWRGRIRLQGDQAYLDVQRQWYDTLSRAGLATAHWPASWGGAALSIPAMSVYYEELARADAPGLDLYLISLYHLPATLNAYGTPGQRAQYLEGVRTGGVIWCQGFSEPGSGSDLASLKTRAVRRGDAYIISGQKTWTSYGRFANYCLLLARTDANAARKHDGISYFILDLKSPGVTIRPIRQITGEADFNEMFLDEVEIPVENLIGQENQGWQIAQSTLTTERGLLIFEQIARLGYAFERDHRLGRESWLRDPAQARAFAAFLPRIRAIKAMTRALLDELAEDPHGGAQSSTYVKLYSSAIIQDYNRFMARRAGLEGQLFAEPLRSAGHHSGDVMGDYLHSYAWSISGGSSEIMRNIIAERFLGLPR